MSAKTEFLKDRSERMMIRLEDRGWRVRGDYHEWRADFFSVYIHYHDGKVTVFKGKIEVFTIPIVEIVR